MAYEPGVVSVTVNGVCQTEAPLNLEGSLAYTREKTTDPELLTQRHDAETIAFSSSIDEVATNVADVSGSVTTASVSEDKTATGGRLTRARTNVDMD